jgi:hypothetical protein
MKAEDFILNGGSQWEPVKESVDSIKDRVLIFGFFFTDFIGTFVSETKVDVDLAVLMISSDEMNLLRVDALKGQEKANGFKGVASSINEISKKNVVVVLDIFFLSVFMWRSIQLKETHQVSKLAMNVSEYFQRSLWGQNHRLVYNHFFCHVAQMVDMFRLKVNIDCLCIHELFRLQKLV